jgi:hypothetical protein
MGSLSPSEEDPEDEPDEDVDEEVLQVELSLSSSREESFNNLAGVSSPLVASGSSRWSSIEVPTPAEASENDIQNVATSQTYIGVMQAKDTSSHQSHRFESTTWYPNSLLPHENSRRKAPRMFQGCQCHSWLRPIRVGTQKMPFPTAAVLSKLQTSHCLTPRNMGFWKRCPLPFKKEMVHYAAMHWLPIDEEDMLLCCVRIA